MGLGARLAHITSAWQSQRRRKCHRIGLSKWRGCKSFHEARAVQKCKLSRKCLKEPAGTRAHERAETWGGKTLVPFHSTSPGLARKVPPIHLFVGWFPAWLLKWKSHSSSSDPYGDRSSAYHNLPAEKDILPAGPRFCLAHCHATPWNGQSLPLIFYTFSNRFAISTSLLSHHLANTGSSASSVTADHPLQTWIFFTLLSLSISAENGL